MFDNILGHNRIKRQLQRDIAMRTLHHAYLFSGPSNVGKMEFVKEFISQVRTGKPFDDRSPFASQWRAGEGPGFIAFFDQGESLLVEKVRMMEERIFRKTAEQDFSFCFVEHAERMTKSAANALLKMLEEPAERFIFIMTTSHEHVLLPTIRSRMTIFRFASIPQTIVEQFLQTKTSNELLVREILKLSGGRIGLAKRLLQDKTFLETMRQLFDLAILFFQKDMIDRFVLAEHLTSELYKKEDLMHFLIFLTAILREQDSRRFIPQMERLQKIRTSFHETQVNRRLQLEELFLFF